VAARPVFACAHRWRGTVTLARASRRARCLASLGPLRLRRSPVRSLPLAPLRSPPASRHALPPSAPLDAPRVRRVTRLCTMLRMSAPGAAPIPAQSARHCLAHSAPQCPPLTRRGRSDPPSSPASIFPLSRTAWIVCLTRRAGLGFHTPRID